MRFTYDGDADAAYVYLREARAPGDVASSHMCDVDIPNTAVVLEFGEGGTLLGIELLGARKLLGEDVLNSSR